MGAGRDETLAVRISRTLAERIIAGEIAPDSRLRQDHVAAEFGASHVPVCEVFPRLEAQGLAVLYGAGLAWLALFVPLARVVELGQLPFVLGDLVKIAVVALAARVIAGPGRR